ncbi:wax ester/triacylglycerol synthase family O-acyltransferase [Sinimarinibacterium sp. NLF-5-8]|uniref:WS/DGAT/MGAT family O-acyltransferase n=1 Tax=Sinimarinibacterium sp. NLF-5-8 TaxID=2698684 RepID=UPI00137C3847|nr:wax ester/triacylglycerol synthase family O-acyltransferase [Sinimarinibacterium sp. NLF-5-8]QHS10204.1 wax ester/triacylglycerol synthase family O-acyltransferase [Sinimarinibacterium sp. NLF-5-8]
MKIAKRLNPLDRTFLAAETRESMMHVGSLMEFTLPEDAPADWLRGLIDEVRAQAKAYPPWNLKLRHPQLLTSPLQAWLEDDDFDVDYHVRRSALPPPGDERELGILVSRLHSHAIDFHRPPWELHIIEGLEGGRIALYIKVHHALVDGYTGAKLLTRSLAKSPEDRDTPMFFAQPPPPSKISSEGGSLMAALLDAARAQIGSTKVITHALKKTLGKQRGALVAPMQAPKSRLNQRISRNRRFATQQFQLERLRAVAKRYNGTLNDVVLALCGGALRQLLCELGELPQAPLTAMLPVNIRPKDDPGGGNAVGAILASLGTDTADPIDRIAAIIASTREAKAQLSGMTRGAILQYSALLMSPLLLSQIPGAVGRIRPAFNLVISNVPGPREALYFRGARMDGCYPLSIPFHGYALNITVVSYLDTLNFGFIGCRDTVPHLQRLAIYSRDALAQLEAG